MICGVVKVNIASLYLDASEYFVLVDEALHGTDVNITKELENFYKVETFYGYEGYVQKSQIEICEDNIQSWNAKIKMTVTKPYVDIKIDPKIQSHIIGGLSKGSVVATYKNKSFGGYRKIYLVDGTEGYIREEFLTEYIKPSITPDIIDEENIRNNIVENAISYLGAQYRWGGKTSLGIDCSGLCFISYLLEGITIFRDAKIKEPFPIKKIDIGIIKKADLIFFKDHVGIYIEKSQFIHSSYKNNGVHINSLNPQDENYNEELSKSITCIGSIF